ncbi:NAD(P)-dependent oxidoreductase [Spirosoma validum]|uniref:SDR family oxidoreductase n=1 Tax=Spirosoma validum TaxID=2771355 RepID=A0A927B226_9BACT|nr:SDR family oxidoreductase [Spirosoma validum]MBD2754160.1 SDR family oxidoreductase [Spirosoma validum]
MKLLIFGSTGSIGRQLVEQALAQGHTVTAFTRRLTVPEFSSHPGLILFQGDVLDFTSVKEAVKDQDVVLCALGAGRKGGTRSEGTQNIIRAMKAVGTKRFICQTTLGVGDSEGNLNVFWKYIMFGLLLKQAFVDHEIQEKYIQQSSLDWIIVRPAAFTDGERTGTYRHGFDGSAEGLTLKISRADVADFMLKQLTDDTYLHKTPGLSY